MADQDNHFVDKLTPKQRQFLTLGGIAFLLFGVLWAVFSITDTPKQPGAQTSATPGQRKVTNLGVMAPGAQLDPREKWIGEAGKDVAQLKQDRDQARSQIANQERFNQEIMNRFDALKQDLARAPQAPPAPASLSAGTSPAYPPNGALAASSNANLPPPPPPARQLAGAPTTAPSMIYEAPPIGRVRVTLAETSKPAAGVPNAAGGAVPRSDDAAKAKSVDNYLPVSFTRAVLLGGLDAPTGGQSQTNPHPVLLRLVDSAVLPNRYRGEVRECFVIGAGYGDISSERAYVRTENLSCIRHDGSTLEIAIQGSIFGEDGKVGMRGRLVTKQGQLLANALLAGVVSGIGTAFSQYYTTTTTSTFGTISTTDPNKAIQSGLGTGVGSAMNRLANYYISLAEKIFPVIEIDAGRMVDVVLTKGVVIDAPLNVGTIADPTTNRPARQGRLQRAARDEDED
jgi:conjugal transfer pilus assembly protein TraB